VPGLSEVEISDLPVNIRISDRRQERAAQKPLNDTYFNVSFTIGEEMIKGILYIVLSVSLSL
jgi:hypothetical protein